MFSFRINLSHTKIEDLEETIEKIKELSNVPIVLTQKVHKLELLNFQ